MAYKIKPKFQNSSKWMFKEGKKNCFTKFKRKEKIMSISYMKEKLINCVKPCAMSLDYA